MSNYEAQMPLVGFGKHFLPVSSFGDRNKVQGMPVERASTEIRVEPADEQRAHLAMGAGTDGAGEAERTVFAFKGAAGSAASDGVPGEGDAVLRSVQEHERDGPFLISDVVARIDAFQRDRDARAPTPIRRKPAQSFRFATDMQGVIRQVDGVSRAPLIGLSLDFAGSPEMSRVDGVASGAFRRRARFSNARLMVEGDSDASGDWLISGVPCFDTVSGRFVGYRCSARRPRRDERAGPPHDTQTRAAAQQIRQLVHELRTPAGAISGFAEMIEKEYLGPVPAVYRDRANIIRQEARQLLGVIEDLDLAARLDDDALDLRPQPVLLHSLFAEVADELRPLMTLREVDLTIPQITVEILGDPRAVHRLLSRFTATLIALALPGDTIVPKVEKTGAGQVALRFDRPSRLRFESERDLVVEDEEVEDMATLGTGFALRLSRNLATELGGALFFGKHSLTLRLPLTETPNMGPEQTR